MTFWSDAKQDAAYAIGSARKAPTFTVVALITLALGIGANTAIFSVINSVADFVRCRIAVPSGLCSSGRPNRPPPCEALTPGRLVDFRDQLTSVSAMAGISQIPLNLTGSGEPERLNSSSVSSNFFDILGVTALLGEAFHASAADDRAVVLSYGLWVRRFGSDPSIIGRQITLNGSARTVVAVMPREFDWPAITAMPTTVNGPQLWIPGDRTRHSADACRPARAGFIRQQDCRVYSRRCAVEGRRHHRAGAA